MVVRDFISLKKHLSSARSSSVYLLAIQDDYERQKGIQMILPYLLSEGSAPLFFTGGTDLSMREVYDALQSPPLFGGEAVVVIEGIDKIGKKELENLSSQIQSSSLGGCLILASRVKTSLFSAVEKSGVVFDLTEEKPWDKEKRIFEQMHRRVENGGKRLSSDVAPLVLERVGSDSSLLDQEIDKLICFVGDKPNIERSDVFRITSASRIDNLWKTAEEIVWEGGQNVMCDSFYGLIPALRSQLHTGRILCELLSSQKPREEWSTYLPKLWPKVVEKRTAQTLKLGAPYFRKGLALLFEVEKLSRSESTKEEALFDLFRINLVSYARR